MVWRETGQKLQCIMIGSVIDKERVSWECMEGSFNPEFEMLRNASRSRSHLNCVLKGE